MKKIPHNKKIKKSSTTPADPSDRKESPDKDKQKNESSRNILESWE